MKPIARLAAFTALVIAVAGCDAVYTRQPGGGFGPPQVVMETPGGDYPLYAPTPGPASEPNLAAPPGFYAQTPTSLPNPVGGWESGTYDGIATLLDDPIGNCDFRITMTNMHVHGGQARFAGFHGRIGPDGGVRMADGSQNWMIGHYAGSHFSGTYTNRWCTYSLSLDRVGP